MMLVGASTRKNKSAICSTSTSSTSMDLLSPSSSCSASSSSQSATTTCRNRIMPPSSLSPKPPPVAAASSSSSMMTAMGAAAAGCDNSSQLSRKSSGTTYSGGAAAGTTSGTVASSSGTAGGGGGSSSSTLYPSSNLTPNNGSNSNSNNNNILPSNSQHEQHEQLSKLTINKLQFTSMGCLYGRDNETKILHDAIDRIITQIPTTATTTSLPLPGGVNNGNATSSSSRRSKIIRAAMAGTTTTTTITTQPSTNANASTEFFIGKKEKGDGTDESSKAKTAKTSTTTTKKKKKKDLTSRTNDLNHQNQRRGLVLVSGVSGTGKSSLVQQLSKRVMKTHGGFFVTGKFDLQQRDEPYAGIVSACHELCDQIENIDEPPPSTVVQVPQHIGTEYDTPDPPSSVFAISSPSTSSNKAGRSRSTTIITTFEQIQLKLKAELGAERRLLTRVIPGLKRIFGFDTTITSTTPGGSACDGSSINHDSISRHVLDDDDEEVELLEARNRFNYAFRRLMRVISSFGPLVLVLDDLQWSDTASLDLMETLLTDNENPSFMMIGCYRSNEVDSSHRLSKFIRDMKKKNLPISSKSIKKAASKLKSAQQDLQRQEQAIAEDKSYDGNNVNTQSMIDIIELHIDDLRVNDINGMLVDLLTSHAELTLPLAELVHAKTNGNIFYVVQLLQTLQREGMLHYNLGLMKWEWDMRTIEEKTQTTLNVVDLVKLRIRNEFEKDTIMKLPIAACLGANFDVPTFDLVSRALSRERMFEFINSSELGSGSVRSSGVANTTDTFSAFGKSRKGSKSKEKRDDSPTSSSGSNNQNSDGSTESNAWIKQCLDQGLLVASASNRISCGSGHFEVGKGSSYRWSHDKVQEAALALIQPGKFDLFSYLIGCILQEKLEPDELIENHLFVTVNLLNIGVNSDAVAVEKPKMLTLATLNLEAGLKATGVCAFASASKYLETAIKLLPEKHWAVHYELSLDIFTAAADAEYCLCNFDRMNDLCNVIFAQSDRPIEDTFHARKLLVESLLSIGKYVEAEKACIDVLESIGCTFPKSEFMRTVATITGVIKAKRVIQKATEADIHNIPRCEDKTRQFGIRIMELLTEAAMATGSNIIALPLLRQLEWTFQYGFLDTTNLTFDGVALVLTSILGELKLGQKCAEFGQIMHSRTMVRRTVARHIVASYGLTLHFLTPFSVCMKESLTAYQVGMEMGDTLFGLWGIQFYLAHGQRSGKSLMALEADYNIYTRQMKEAIQIPPYHFSLAYWQTIQNLMGIDENSSRTHPYELSGDVIRESEFMREVKKTKNKSVIYLINNRKLYLACIFGHYRVAADIALKMGEKFYQDSPGWPAFVDQFWYGAIACISVYRETKKRKYLQYFKRQFQKINGWIKQGSPNYIQWSLLLEAELLSLNRRKTKETREVFQNAARAAGRMGRIHEQALIRERYADYLLRDVKNEEEAKYHLNQATKLFEEWGAKAKVLQLQQKHSDLLQALPDEISVLDSTFFN